MKKINMTNSIVEIHDIVRDEKSLFIIKKRIKKGVYQFRNYPTKTYLSDPDDERWFRAGATVDIHHGEVTMTIIQWRWKYSKKNS